MATNSTAPLEGYIQRALGDPTASIFARSDLMPPPYLIKEKINYILTFRGCFNPPYQGHKETLCHGFFRGGEGIHLIAAFIFPLDDYSVAWKYNRGKSCSKDLILTLQQRINLINNSGLYGGWHWCHPHGEPGSEAFKDRLISEAAVDGFNIQYITLTGPDHVDRGYGSLGYYGPTIVVGTGDRERTSLRMETETGLRKLTRYSDWRVEALEELFIQQLGAGGNLTWLEQKLSMLFPRSMTNLPGNRDERLQMIKDRLRTGMWRLGQTRMCHRSKAPSTEWLRYVPTRFFGMTGGVWFLGYKEQQLSSTRLRRALASSNDAEQLKKSITGVALSPQLLIQYLRPHQQRTTLKRKRTAEEGKEAEVKRVEREGQARKFKKLKQTYEQIKGGYLAKQRTAWRGRQKKTYHDWDQLSRQDRQDILHAEKAMTRNWRALKDPTRKEDILFQHLDKMLRDKKKGAAVPAKVLPRKPGPA
ncbi:hypothetical protein BKA58DRAFT_201028 [Alternaria rosae]|uniref:uncharacterized protein n=1 Tax=Alternaria rosae TaxID=1187941 RepID=UPI001E8D9B7D|nr:uncharacterized protein BKA58DRAFT_201028 [Alternaria rosae]KAH6868785.1 hypothetical protein BKA58DRAFT_201028 [Alternaria rosae]